MNPMNQSPPPNMPFETNRRTVIQAAVAGFLGLGLEAIPAFSATPTKSQEEQAELLFVQTAKNVTLEKSILTLQDVSLTTLFFSDRPKRMAGHMTTKEFLLDWGEGKNSFAVNPPNANLSIFGGEEIVDIILEIKNPRLEGTNLIYEVSVLLEDFPMISGPCSLFIDPVRRVVRRRHRRHRRRVRRHVIIH